MARMMADCGADHLVLLADDRQRAVAVARPATAVGHYPCHADTSLMCEAILRRHDTADNGVAVVGRRAAEVGAALELVLDAIPAAIQRVEARLAVERVVARTAVHRVRARPAVELVG